MKPRVHAWQFAHRVLPDHFFAKPTRVVSGLGELGGRRWLDERWQEAGGLLDPSEQVDHRPSYTFEGVSPPWRVIFVTLPEPLAPTEAARAALCHRPYTAPLFFWTTPRQTRYFLQELDDTGQFVVTEWTGSGDRVVHGPVESGPAAFGAFLEPLLR